MSERLNVLRVSRMQPGAEVQHRDGPWVLRRYVNPLIIVGPPRAGKTNLMRCLMRRASAHGMTWEVTATMANLAFRHGGTHLHPLLAMLLEDSKRAVPTIVEGYVRRIEANDVLRWYIQDEFGTWDDHQVSVLDLVFQRVRRCSQPFGNVMLVVDGDDHQLQPVCKEG